MFVRKLVQKASSINKPGENLDGLKASELDPGKVFHYGIPSGSTMFAYDSIQKILAISSKDGQIKLFGKDNTQALLECSETVPSKFLQFFENQGVLLNVNFKNHIEVWDIDKKLLSYVHMYEGDITSFAVMQQGLYMYVGDSVGNISVLKLDQQTFLIVQMKYTIPLSASHGNPTEVSGDIAVMQILPQPTAESKRILIVFKDGIFALWDIRESKTIFSKGGNMLQSLHHETKKVTTACWACPFGSKVVVGYSNGEIFIWGIPPAPNSKTEVVSEYGTHTMPICKLNLGYKLEKIPIGSLKWAYADGKASRLYVIGASDIVSANSLQIVLLNEHTESRTIKLGLHLLEPCIDMEAISSCTDQSKYKQEIFLLLGKSGHIYAYDDSLIEKYLLQYQSGSPPSLPKEVMVKMPFIDSSITVAKFITKDSYTSSSLDEDYIMLAKSIPPLFPFETKPRDLTPFSGFAKVKNLYITGHSNGAINFWDASCPLFLPILSLKQQSEDDYSLSGIALTALYFDCNSQLLVSGDQSGMVRIYKLKQEPQANSFMSLQASTKKGNNPAIHSIKLIKVKGSVLCLLISQSSRHLTVGSDQGFVSQINMEGPTILYEKYIPSKICAGIISLQFGACSLHGFEKNVLVLATKDSSILALDTDTGNTLSSSTVAPKKPYRALFMQVLDGQDTLARRSNTSTGLDVSNGNLVEDVIRKQGSLLLCSEKAVYVFSLVHIVQGVKKVLYKKKFHSSYCCWASTFYSPSDVGLILIFASGKLEIRSLPELSLVKEASVKGFTHSTPKPNSFSDISICSSCDGELVMMNGDQEIFVVSVLLRKEIFRMLDSVTQVYRKGLMQSQEGLVTAPIIHKEKKKGIFSSVINDFKGSKGKHVTAEETEDARESIEGLSTIFSIVNFPGDIEKRESLSHDEEHDIDIDDIDLEDPIEKHKEQSKSAPLNKQILASKFQSFKGKLKQMKVKSEKNLTKEVHEVETPNAVDQIKRRYGFSSSTESAAKMAASKLHENLRKLQGINQKTTEMQDTAKSFSSNAKEMLRIVEQDKQRQSL